MERWWHGGMYVCLYVYKNIRIKNITTVCLVWNNIRIQEYHNCMSIKNIRISCTFVLKCIKETKQHTCPLARLPACQFF